MDRAIAQCRVVRVAELKGGEQVCKACPILLIALALGLTRVPVESKASISSDK